MSEKFIFLPRFEIDQFQKELCLYGQKCYQTEYIQLFIKQNGIPSFPDYEYIPLECLYCMCDDNRDHEPHQDIYAFDVLNSILDRGWFNDIYQHHFKSLGFNYFLKWLNRYVEYKLSLVMNYGIVVF
jgi:hypothetical protein